MDDQTPVVYHIFLFKYINDWNLFVVNYDYAHYEIHVYIDFIPSGIVEMGKTSRNNLST